MWRWTAILLAPIAYVLVDKAVKANIIAGSSMFGDIVRDFAGLTAGVIVIAIVVVAGLRH